MQNERKFTNEHCSFGSISFQMLTEILRARSFNILEALNADHVDVAHIRRLATHMSLSADDLINVTGLTTPTPDLTEDFESRIVNKKAEPSSLQSVLELSKIAAERRLREHSIELRFEPMCKEQFISGNPWEVSWALFFILNRIATSQSRGPVSSSVIKVDSTNTENMVDICMQSKHPLTTAESSEGGKFDAAMLSELEWFCFSQILRKNDLYFIQREQRTECGERTFEFTLRLPTFQPGFE